MNAFGIKYFGVKMKVFINGSFDVLHNGHLDLLNYAKSLGDFLHVAIDSDRRISEKKGVDRPFNNEINRVALLENLKAVDKVAVFDSDNELINIIKLYEPDIMIVGSDWKGKPIIGSQHTKQLIYYERVLDESTTKTIEGYINRRQMHR
jgi:D-beta-D-heptose 7-phosphate kinase/D-beta-D-heptose 1-phosphate adenosyltransferase